MSSGFFNTSIPAAIEKIKPLMPMPKHVLIRVLDSSVDGTEIARVVQAGGAAPSIRASGVLVDVLDFYQLIEQPNIFCGFDEVWLADSADFSFEIPDDVVLTTDDGPIDEEMSIRVERLLLEYSLKAALGDGCGMNFVTTDRELWEGLLRAFASASQ